MATIARDGGGSCFRSWFPSWFLFVQCLQPVAALFRLWHSLEYLQLVAALASALVYVRAMSPTGGGSRFCSRNISNRWRTPSRLASCQLSFHIRLNVCCLLYIRLNVYPLPPLNGLKIETHSNFNAIYNFGIDSLRNISL